MESVTQQGSSSSSSSSAAFPGTIFCRLPVELLERVFSFLPLPLVFAFRLVCKHWNSILRSPHFLTSFDSRNQWSEEKWITFFDGLGYAHERSLLLYDPVLRKWRCISLAFLPEQFNIAIAAGGGLFCVASSITKVEKTQEDRTVMCVCNPFTKMYKELPSLQLDLINAHALMELKNNGSYKVYVMSSALMAVYDSSNENWIILNMAKIMRPRSPVICHGSIYGLRDEGSLWWERWKLVVSNVNTLVSANREVLFDGLYAGDWAVLNQNNWGKILSLIRRPRLLGANEYLLLIGGLKRSALSYSCSTFVVFKFDFMTIEWSEIARMPQDLYCDFQDLAFVKIFGSFRDVFFLCEKSHTTVACNLSNGQVLWHKITAWPLLEYCHSALFKGFAFDLKVGSVV